MYVRIDTTYKYSEAKPGMNRINNCQEAHFYGYAVYVLRKLNKLHTCTRIKRLVLGDLLHPVVTKAE